MNADSCTITGDVNPNAVTDGSASQDFVIAYTITDGTLSDTGTYTLTVNAVLGAVTVALDADIADDDVVNIAEKAAGFAISGTVEAGAMVNVTLGGSSTARPATVNDTTWMVAIQADDSEITGTSVAVTAMAILAGRDDGTETRTITVDLTPPTATYTAPGTLTVGTAITTITPGGASPDVAGYAVQGGTPLPPGLTLTPDSGVISGTPTTANTATAAVTIGLTDTAGNPAEVMIPFPAVDMGSQTLTGFAYSAPTAVVNLAAPTVTAPTGAVAGSSLSYASGDTNICTVESSTGALTLVAAGACAITVTASATSDYLVATDTFTITVTPVIPIATLAGTLTEAGLFAATAPTVTVTLANTEYVDGSTLALSHFTVTDTVAGSVSVSDFTRDSSTVATLTLAYSGEDITTAGTLSVTLAAAGHTVADDLMTDTIPITASTGVNICGRTTEVRDAIVTGTATECTSITGLATIMSLNLNNQGIATLQSGDFAGLTGLMTLDLRRNTLTTLPDNIFAGLTALMMLKLDNNQINTLQANIFAGLTELTTVTLATNQLAALPADIFAGLSKLTNLSLFTNLLTALRADVFNGLDVLRVLSLSENSFDPGGLPAGVFDEVLNTLGPLETQFVVDTRARDAHFVCSRADFAAIVAVTTGVDDCIRISSAQLTAALADATLTTLIILAGTDTLTLTPPFASDMEAYAVSAPNSVENVVVEVAANFLGVTEVTVNGVALSGSAAQSGLIPLTAGMSMAIPVVVTAADGSTTMTYTVTATRAAPAGVPTVSGTYTASINEGAAPATALSSVITDAGQDPATVAYRLEAGATLPAGLTLNADGSFSGTASFEATTPVNSPQAFTFQWTYTDGTNTTTPETATITVTDVNRAPTFSAINVRLMETSELPCLCDFVMDPSEVPADSSIRYSVTSGLPATLVNSLNENAGSFDPATFPQSTATIAAPETVVIFQWTYTDANGSFPQTGTFTVQNLNRDPVIGALPDVTARTVLANQPLSLMLTGSDPDTAIPDPATGDPAPTWSITPTSLGATIDTDTGVFSWTPTDAHIGTQDFTVTLTDTARSVTVTLQIIVNAPPPSTATLAAPTALTGATLTTATVTVTLENTTYADASSLGPDDFRLTDTIAGTVSVSVGGVTRTGNTVATLALAHSGEAIPDSGTLSVTVLASAHAGTGDLPAGSVPITVTNTVPDFGSETVTAQTYTVGTSIGTVTLPPAPGGNGASAYALAPTLPSGLTFTAADRTISGTPGTAQVATTYTYTASDSDTITIADTAALTFTITINAVPSATLAAPTALTGATLTTATVTVTLENTTYADASSLGPDDFRLTDTIAGTVSVSVGGVTRSGNTVATLALAHSGEAILDSGTLSVTVLASAHAGTGDLPAGSVPITVTNTVPGFGSETVTAQTYTVGTSIGTVTLPPAPGGNGASAYALAPTLPSGLTFTAADRTISGTPGTAQVATTYTYTASDSDTIAIADTAALTFTITINAVSSATLAAPTALTGATLTTATVTVTLENTTYADASSLGPDDFRLTDTIAGTVSVSVGGVTRSGDTVATLALAHSGEAIPDSGTLSVTVLASAHAGTGDLPAGSVPITVTNTVPDFGSETVTAQTYTVGTSIGTVTLPPAPGGNGASAYALAPTLPSGLTFTAADRTISGTPGTAQVATTYTYTASDSDTITTADTAALTFTITINAVPSATLAAPTALTGATLTTAMVTVTLENTTYADASSLGPDDFRLSDTIAGTVSVSVGGVTRSGNTVATLALAHSGEAILDSGTLSVTVLASAHAGTGDLPAGSVPITVTNTVPDFGSETVTAQTYTVGTSIGTVTLPPAPGGNGASAYALAPTLPSGLTFTAADRTISGTPGTAQVATTYTYTASDSDTIAIADTAALTFTITINAVSSATLAAPTALTGATLTTATVTVTLENTTYADASSLGPDDFRLTDTIAGTVSVSVGGVTRSGDTVATLALAHSGEAIPDSGTLSVTVLASAHAGTGDLPAGSVPITVTNTVPDFGSETVTAQTYTVGTSIGTVTLPPAPGGNGAAAYALAPTLPTGLTFTVADRTITGTPAAGTAQAATAYTYTASDSDTNTATTDADVLTFTIQIADPSTSTVTVTLDADIAGNDIVNIAEKAAGFAISGAVEAGAMVNVTLGSSSTARPATVTDTTWTVTIPADDSEITGASVAVTATAMLAGRDDGTATRTLTVDLTAPTATYVAPATLTVGTAITTITPGTPSADITTYAVQSGTLPPGLTLDGTGGGISGTPTTETAAMAVVTIRLTDTNDNPADVSLTFPAVALGSQTLTGFAYSAATATVGQPAPTVTAPTGQQAGSSLSYASSDTNICTVESSTGALTLVAAGTCAITVTASATTNYLVATDTITITVVPTAIPVATLTGTLTEASLFATPAPTVTVTLANTEYEAAPGTLMQSHFSVTDTVDGTVRVSGFTRDSDTEATLTLAYSGEDITTTGTLSVILAAAGHTGTDDLMTSTIAITASAGANVCGRTAQVRDAIVTASTATDECTSVTDLASILELDLSGQLSASPGSSRQRSASPDSSRQRSAPLQNGDFAGLTGLQRLDLSGNALEALPPNIFAGLTALQRLDLGDNALEALPSNIFADLSALMTLLLENNQFTEGAGLPAGVFDDVLGTVETFTVDDTVREAHFVCSRDDADAIVAATSGVTDCLRITTAQLNAAGNATLSGLTLSAGTLDPVFGSATTTYTVSVPSSVTSVTVTPTTTNAGATIRVDGNTVNSGSPSAAIALTADTSREITIIVTAADGSTTQTYTLTITIGSLTEERTAQLNEQILPQVFLKLADVGSRLIADRLSAGAIVGGGTISSQAHDGEAGSAGLMAQLGQWLSGDAAEVELSRRLQNLDDFELRDFIDGLSFAADGEQVGMAGGSLYGIGNYTRLSGDEDGVDWDGDLYSGYVGLDKRLRNGALAGVLLSYSKGEFEYADTIGDEGEYDLDISSVNPYIGWSLSEDLDIWASVGYGIGEVELNDSDGSRSSDLSVGSVSVGASGRLVVSDELIAGGRSELRLRGDGSASQVDFDRSDAGFTDISSHRLRLIVEASHLRSGASGSVRSGLELGVRHDGGDGQDGQGLELGGSIEWGNTRGLTLSGRGRVLTLADYDEWGVSGILRLLPGQGGRGLSFSLSPGYGRDDSGTEQLWQRGASAVSSAQTARLRMDGEVGYGLWMLGGTVQPYLGASLLQGGGSTQRMGARLELGRGVQLELEGSRHERTSADAEHRIELQWRWNW